MSKWISVIGLVFMLYILVVILWFCLASSSDTPGALWSREISGCDRADIEVHGDRIYVKRIFNRMSRDRYYDLQCFDLEGNPLWDHTGQISNFHVSESGNVYLGYNGLAALDPKGNVLWQTEEQKISVVMIPWAVGETGYLYVRNGDPHHYIFDLEGNLIWEDDQTERVDNMFRAAVAKDGTLYLFRGGYLRAIKPTEGEVWRIAMTHAEPQMLASGNILTEFQGTASCYSPEGKLLWEYDIIKQSQSNRSGNASQYTSTSCLASGNGVIYFSRFCGALHCLDEDGNELWRLQAAAGRFGGFSFLRLGPEGNVYCTENGKALCLDPAGNEIWKVNVTPMTDLWQITNDRHALLEDHNIGLLPGADKKRFTMLNPAGEQLWTIVEDGSFPGPQPCNGGSALIVRAYDVNGKRIWPHDKPANVILELVR